jgi:RND family efflux transporter MFP subunit
MGCFDKSTETAVAAPAPAPTASSPALRNVAALNAFSVSGPLIVEHQLDVLAQRDGVVAKLLHEAGARVTAGEMLAQLDDRQLSADLEAARAKTLAIEADLNNWKAEAKVLESDYQRAKKMWDAQLITQEQLEHAKFKAEADQWDVKRVEQLLVNAKQTEHSLELELEKTRIRAPFLGIVARRYVREGQQIAKGDRLFWVTAEGPLRMRFTLPQKFVGQIKKGEQFPLTAADIPDQNHQARVVEVSPVVDPSSGTFEVMVELEGAPGALRPGMDASVRIEKMQ